jgi:hypothetical protein
MNSTSLLECIDTSFQVDLRGFNLRRLEFPLDFAASCHLDHIQTFTSLEVRIRFEQTTTRSNNACDKDKINGRGAIVGASSTMDG